MMRLALLTFLISLSGWIHGLKNPQFTKQKSVVGEQVISTESVEYAATLSKDVNEIYFTRSKGAWGKGKLKSSIYYSRKEDGIWNIPTIVSFSGVYDDSSPHLTKDERTIYFVSNRPGPDALNTSSNIWKVQKKKDGTWKDPVMLPYPLNSLSTEDSPVTDHFGNLYFASTRTGSIGQGDLYCSRKQNNKWLSPVNLGPQINSEKGEWNLGISGDGRILIFEASGRVENLSPYGDLYIVFKKGSKWSTPQNIKELNTTGSDLYPEFSHDNNYLYFTSSDSLQSPKTTIYKIHFEELLDRYKALAKFPSH